MIYKAFPSSQLRALFRLIIPDPTSFVACCGFYNCRVSGYVKPTYDNPQWQIPRDENSRLDRTLGYILLLGLQGGHRLQ
jgi:hypothetical protein